MDYALVQHASASLIHNLQAYFEDARIAKTVRRVLFAHVANTTLSKGFIDILHAELEKLKAAQPHMRTVTSFQHDTLRPFLCRRLGYSPTIETVLLQKLYPDQQHIWNTALLQRLVEEERSFFVTV